MTPAKSHGTSVLKCEELDLSELQGGPQAPEKSLASQDFDLSLARSSAENPEKRTQISDLQNSGLTDGCYFKLVRLW